MGERRLVEDVEGFADAVKLLAQRFGMSLPELEQSDEQRANAAERETLLKVHESAAAWFKTRYSSFAAASSDGKWPLVLTARRSFEFNASIAFVE